MMEIFAGFVLCLFIELLLYGAYRFWRSTLPPAPPQPPLTAAQVANEAVYDAHEAEHPMVVNLRLQRHMKRGHRRRYMEDEQISFD